MPSASPFLPWGKAFTNHFGYRYGIAYLVNPPLHVLPLIGPRLYLVWLVECHLLFSAHLGHAGTALAAYFGTSLLEANLVNVHILNVDDTVVGGLLLLTTFLMLFGLQILLRCLWGDPVRLRLFLVGGLAFLGTVVLGSR